MEKIYKKKQCISKLSFDITAYDSLQKELKTKLVSKKGCDAFSFEVPKNGYYTLLATNKTIKDNILYHRVAKVEYLHGKHGTDDVYKSSLSNPVENTKHTLDLIRLRDASEDSFYYKHATGDILKFKAFLNGKALSNATVTMYTDTGWAKSIKTDKNGIAKFHIIKDYFPEWTEFDRRHKGEFLIALNHTLDSKGEINTQPYESINYTITYPASFYPSDSEYKSYGYGLILLTLTLLVSGIVVYRYRKNRTKPFEETQHNG